MMLSVCSELSSMSSMYIGMRFRRLLIPSPSSLEVRHPSRVHIRISPCAKPLSYTAYIILKSCESSGYIVTSVGLSSSNAYPSILTLNTSISSGISLCTDSFFFAYDRYSRLPKLNTVGSSLIPVTVV